MKKFFKKLSARLFELISCLMLIFFIIVFDSVIYKHDNENSLLMAVTFLLLSLASTVFKIALACFSETFASWAMSRVSLPWRFVIYWSLSMLGLFFSGFAMAVGISGFHWAIAIGFICSGFIAMMTVESSGNLRNVLIYNNMFELYCINYCLFMISVLIFRPSGLSTMVLMTGFINLCGFLLWIKDCNNRGEMLELARFLKRRPRVLLDLLD